jgi:hypothetical protein
MAISAYAIFEIQANGSNSNSGLFDNAYINTTLSTSNGTSATPSVTASNYTFVSADINNYLYIKAGTNWIPGWYKITAVNAGAATIDAAIGNVLQLNHRIATTQGISTAASASSGYWTIDYTQTPTAARTYTDLVIVTNQNYVQSAAFPFTVNMIGNSVKISGGVNFTTGIYSITNVVGTTAYLDRNVGTVGATGGTGTMGGALASWDGFSSPTTAMGNHFYVYIKGSSGIFNWSGIPTISSSVPAIIGYSTVRGDFGKPIIKLSASSTAFSSNAYIYLSNVSIDGQNNTGTVGVTNANYGIYNYVVNCDFKNMVSPIVFNSGSEIQNCTFDTCSSMSTAITTIANCVIKNCTGSFNFLTSALNNLFINHSGNCFYSGGTPVLIKNNTFYNITGTPIRMYFNYAANNLYRYIIENNLFSNISGYAIDAAGAGSNTMNVFQNNAYFACTSGFHNNTTNVYDFNYAPFTNRNNIALSVSPFISAANLDLRLNNDINGGKLCQGAGQLQTIPLTATVSSTDIGAVQLSSNPIDRNLAPTSKSLTIKQGTTSYTEFLNLIGTGYTIGSIRAYYTRVGSSPVEISLTSQTVNGAWTSGGFVEIDINSMPGIYRFDVPNAVFSSGSSSAILQISNLNTGDKAIIIYKFQDPQNIDLTQTFSASNVAQTVGDALNAARSSGFGRWTLNDRTLSLYSADNTTIVKTFTLNSSTFPTERS